MEGRSKEVKDEEGMWNWHGDGVICMGLIKEKLTFLTGALVLVMLKRFMNGRKNGIQMTMRPTSAFALFEFYAVST